LESWQDAPFNIETAKVKIICLLDAAICGNIVNSEQATLLGIIPLLLKMLLNFKDQASTQTVLCFAPSSYSEIYIFNIVKNIQNSFLPFKCIQPVLSFLW
jgi:hypothetical protein